MNTLADKKGKAFFADSLIHVALPGGVSFSFPIAGNWRLENATSEQLNNVEIDEDGLHWPDIDEDLSFAGLLRGDHGQFVRSPGAKGFTLPRRRCLASEKRKGYKGMVRKAGTKPKQKGVANPKHPKSVKARYMKKAGK